MRLSNVKIEDRLLLRKACRDGCRTSLAEIYRKYNSSIYGYLKKNAPNHDTAEDILQEVFRQVMEGKCRYDGSSDPLNYLIGVAGILLKKELSKVKADCSAILPNDFAELLEDNSNQSPIERLQAIELRQKLQAEISRLPVASRTAIESVYWDEKTSPDAAKGLGCSYNALHKRIQYALGELKKSKIFKSINFDP
ncbi:MAG: RNA polymerase sigma factor [Planctomycetota bacterium]